MILKMTPLTIFLVVAVALQSCEAHKSEDQLLVQEKTLAEDYRLPKDFEPIDYTLRIKPDFGTFTFEGQLTLTVKPKVANLKTITLHAEKGLAISDANVKITTGNPAVVVPLAPINPITRNDISDFLVLTVVNNLIVDEIYTIEFTTYTGEIREAMNGFYRSSYVEGGTTKWLGTTQFQPVHARKVFPCFDEPEYKAFFTVTIDRPKSFSPSLSNMPIEATEELPNDITRETFMITPKMSTYLLAFIVSEFKPAAKTEATDKEQFGVYARPDASDQGEYAFTSGKDLLKAMGEFTGIGYYNMSENLKMDQAGIPDFSAGAMENWGLLTYREAYVMYHNTESSVKYKQQVITILAHEIAHMWFGDYVTCHWWSDTWLNEGFARFFQYRLPHLVDPALDLATQFIPAQVHTAFQVDTSVASDPLTNENVNTPAQISGHFGSISYNKGASVLRMIENLIGEETFRVALGEYLTKMKFQPSYPEDLFDSLELQAETDGSLADYPNYNVTGVMSSWTSQAGYPVLHVKINYDTGNMDLTQQRMVVFGEEVPDVLYNIPITFTTASKTDFTNTKPVAIMSAKTHSIPKDKEGGHEWVVFNKQQTGFYRVNYDAHGWEMLSDALRGDDRTKIHTLNRAQIVDDVLNLAKENVTDYETAFEVIQFLEKESDYAPWAAAIANFNVLRRRFAVIPETLKNLDKHILNLLDHVTTELGLTEKEADNHLTKLFRGIALSFACNLGHEACGTDAVEQFDKLISASNTPINANLREHIYCNALRNGNATHFNKLWEKYEKGNVVNEQIVILGALGCTKDKASLNKFLDQTIADAKPIRDQDLMTAFNSALNGNDENVEIVFDFFKRDLEKIHEVYGSNTQTAINNMISRMKGTQLQRVVVFLKASLSPSGVSSGLSAVADVALNYEWALQHRETIDSWVESKYSGASAIVSSFALLVSMLALLINNNN